MKKKLLNTVSKMLEDGFDFDEHPAQFVWEYPEMPGYRFTMLINKYEFDAKDQPHDMTIMH